MPSSADTVVERLTTVTARVRPDLAALRSRAQQAPDDLDSAVALAGAYVRIARSEADQRYFGRAETVLRHWPDTTAPPEPVRMVRAAIRESTHDFEGALADLDAVVAADPAARQAHLSRASLYELLGRFDEGEADCEPLMRGTTALAATAVDASIRSQRGQAEASLRRLGEQLELATARGRAPGEAFARTVMGEIAARLGRDADAETHFRTAVALDPKGAYTLSALADLYLAQGRAQEAQRLLADKPPADPLTLRLALAERALGDAAWQARAAALGQRFESARLRGDRPHLQAEALYVLALQDRPGDALALARANWDTQKTPTDARLLVTAALAAGEPTAAAPVRAWVEAHRLEDVALHGLLDKAAAP